MNHVVVITYGPAQTIRDAVAQARTLGDRITLVPALPQAVRPCRQQRSARVAITQEVGDAGLTEALADLDPADVVLLIHDDVSIAPDAARALAGHAAATGRVTVPATNERETDGWVGRALPTAAKIAYAEAPATSAQTFRLSCVAAPIEQLWSLTSARLTLAQTILNRATVDVDRLPGAVAVHAGSCQQQTVSPEEVSGDLLVAAMIVRDEEALLPGCLASLAGVVDRVVVVDTGSTDETVAIAERAGAQVLRRPWRDDFAWARNEGLDAVGDAHWILSIDADERLHLEDAAALRTWLATAAYAPGGFTVPTTSVTAESTSAPAIPLPRIFPANARFVGVVHETPHGPGAEPLDWTPLPVPAALHHLGYHTDVVDMDAKLQRNIAIARRGHCSDRAAIKPALDLARSLHAQSRGTGPLSDECARLYLRVATHAVARIVTLTDDTVQVVFEALALDALKRGQPAAAFEHARAGLDLASPTHRLLAAHAIAAAKLTGRAGHALELVDAVAVGKPDAALALRRELALAVCLAQSGDWDDARARLVAALQRPVPAGFSHVDELADVSVALLPADQLERALEVPLSGAGHDDRAAKELLARFHPEDVAVLLTRAAARAAAEGRATPGLAEPALHAAAGVGRADVLRALVRDGLVSEAARESTAQSLRDEGSLELAVALEPD